MMDDDAVIRKSLCKFLRAAFSVISANQIAPFFNVLSAHLCCAMTHIHDDIQVCDINQ